MNIFPFISIEKSLIVLRVAVAIIFLSHAIVRIANSTIERFGSFLETKGFPYGSIWVMAITVFEIVGGIMLAFGYWTKWISLGFILMLIIGIALIHASLGWFVGEHGTGGSEYSFILIVALFVIASSKKKDLKQLN